MNFKTIFLFFSLIIKIDCFIKVPFTYFPDKSYEKIGLKNKILSILDLKMYGLLEIGTPKQLCHIPINFGSNTFFLPEKSSLHYNNNDKIILYDDKNSSSFHIIKEEDTYEGENFISAYYVNDIIYFGDKQAKLDFYLTTSYFFPQFGGLGLQLYPSNDENTATPDINRTFLRKLKINGLINNYIWSIFYYEHQVNDGKINGYLLIGDYPHLSINYPDNKKYNYSLNSIEAEVYNKKIIQTKFFMDNIKIINNEDVILYIIESVFVRLDYNFGGIIAPKKLGLFFEENIFNNLEFCHKDTLNRISTNTFYYCDKNENNINQIKKIFPIIKFENKILNSSFVINVDNLLFIDDNYIYLLLIFDENIDYWTLGIPFLREYQFSINEDSKKIYFYKKIKLIQHEEKIERRTIYIILIIIISIFLFISGLIVAIILYYKNIRKKRKNEIDDDYDYKIKDEENEKIIN